jgi:hypothetical protein
MVALIPLSLILATANFNIDIYQNCGQSFRRSFLSALTLLFLFVGLSTELLSAFNLITSTAISISWIVFNVILLLWYFRVTRKNSINLLVIFKSGFRKGTVFQRQLGILTTITLTTILLITFIVAIVATPNNPDSLTYHLGRIGYWIQNQNVEHFPSHILRSISFSPFSEYVHLHSMLLSGSDRFVQLLQWCCLVGTLVYVSLLVNLFSKSIHALRIALCFAVTIPIVVLEAMTTQNDLVVSFFIIATGYYVFDYLASPRNSTLALLCVSIALGILTKGTFVLYATPFGLYMLFVLCKRRSWHVLFRMGASLLFLVLILNFPFWNRTNAIFDSPLGTMSQGNRNASHTLPAMVSSVSKHLVLHLGYVSPGDKYNTFLLRNLENLHDFLGVDLNDSGMTFKMNKINFNEDFAHNFLAAWLIIASLVIAIFYKLPVMARWFYRLSVLSFLLFCVLVSYQIYGSRLHIPFFLLMAPVIGIIYASFSILFQKLLISILLINALPYALLSAAHPFLSTKWFFTDVFPVINKYVGLKIEPEKQSNMMQKSVLYNSPEHILWGDQWPQIQSLVAFTDSVRAQNIGFDFNEASYDYAYQYVLKHRNRHFEHIMVQNPSKILEKKLFRPDCIISENKNENRIVYHGITYYKAWSMADRRIYIPEK